MSSMPPHRKPGSRDLPDNLYATTRPDGRVYYRYRDPRTGKFHGRGYDKDAATKDAMALNAAILAQMAGRRIEGIVSAQDTGPTLGRAVLTHMEVCEDRHRRGKLADNTLKSKRSLCRAIEAGLGGKQPLAHITVRDAAELLAGYVKQGKERQAQSMRSEGMEIFKTAIAEGWTTDNPFAKTRPIDVDVKCARLTWEAFQAILAAADELQPWVANSILLALVSAQRREDVSLFEFKPRKGATSWIENDELWVIQQKTGNRLRIPLSLRLDVLGISLGEVVTRCRDHVVSRHLVHHATGKVGARAGDPVFKDTLTKNFAKARDLAASRSPVPLWDQTKSPPTYRELRSLAERLYDAQGGINTQTLLGHRDPRTTAIYKDTRGAEWVRVKNG